MSKLTAEEIKALVTPKKGYHLSDENGVALGEHIAAQDTEIAALKADNAVLLELAIRDANGGKNGACVECGQIGHHHLKCVLGRVSRADHPGAALLEEHRKALEALDLARLQIDEHAQSAKRAWDAALASENASRKARNEGLEEAARRVDWLAETSEGLGHHDNAAFRRELATALRAMKTAEES